MTKGTEAVVASTESEGYEGAVVAEAPAPVKSWKSWDGRTCTRQPREIPGRQPNADYVNNPNFKSACEAAEIPATKRQASKFRRHFGLAYAAAKRLKNKD